MDSSRDAGLNNTQRTFLVEAFAGYHLPSTSATTLSYQTNVAGRRFSIVVKQTSILVS